MQEIQERPQAGDGGQRGRGAGRHQEHQSANQPISLKGRCQSADIIAAKGGGPGSNLRGSSKPLNFQASNHPTKKVSVAEGFFVLMRDCGGSSRMKRRWTAREMAV